MQVRVSAEKPSSLSAGALVVPVFSESKLDGVAALVDGTLGGAIADILSSGEIKGKANETALVHAKDAKYRRVLVIGLGDRSKFTLASLSKYAGTAVRYLGKRAIKDIAFALPLEVRENAESAAAHIIEGALVGTFDTTTYRTEPDKPIVLDAVAILSTAGEIEFDAKALEAGAQRGRIIGEAVNLARTMAVTPANDMTPTHMAERAREVAKAKGLEFDVLDEDKMQKLGMGSLLGVSQGSDQPAKMIILTYNGDAKSDQKLALVGKGLTFDSGGISIKPAENMHEMKYDMSGGAGVIAAMSAIAALKPKINVIGVVPASENLPGPRAVKPGDVLRAMNGKTIEVINTDAEGRLILADALCYARKLGATHLVDCATLTGACVVALGHEASALMSNDEGFANQFLAVAGTTTERYWRMPLYEEFSTKVKSEVADLRNSTGRPAGTLTAGAFLQNFVDDTPWIHLDIAGTAYVDTDTSYATKGPTGVPVRAFVALAEELAEKGFMPSSVASTNGKKASKKERETAGAR